MDTEPKPRTTGTLVMSIVLLLFGIFWMIAAKNVPNKTGFGSLGPGFLPFWAGASLVIISAFLMIGTLRIKLREKPEPAKTVGVGHHGQWMVLLTILALLIYIILLSRLHFFINTFLLAAVGLALSGEPLKLRLLVVAALISFVLFAIFVFWLQIPLPGSRIFG
ncbi:MAG: tripartite tricarboxylate transporter TctB family protein [Thermodesulfobacteriota bacterium]